MTLLEAKNLNVTYPSHYGDPIWAVRDVSLSLDEGEFVGIVGESGCGKSTLGVALTQMLRPPAQLKSGSIEFQGTDLSKMTKSQIREIRRGGVAMVLQAGMNALNPVRSIEHQIGDILKAHTQPGEHFTKPEIAKRAKDLLSMVELPAEVLDRYPHELSGGMRQRASIALALTLEPKLIVFDEPTTALDVIVQAAVMKTIKTLQRSRGFTAVLISHDMSVVLDATDRTLVMYAGRIVEDQPSSSMLVGKHHPYTEALFQCYGDPRADDIQLSDIPGTPPDLSLEDTGCAFFPRCSQSAAICRSEPPQLHNWQLGKIACHRRTPADEAVKEVYHVK